MRLTPTSPTSVVKLPSSKNGLCINTEQIRKTRKWRRRRLQEEEVKEKIRPTAISIWRAERNESNDPFGSGNLIAKLLKGSYESYMALVAVSKRSQRKEICLGPQDLRKSFLHAQTLFWDSDVVLELSFLISS